MTGASEFDLHVDPAVASIVRPAACVLDDLVVVDRSAALDGALADLVARVRGGETAVPDASLAAVRAMYRRVGLDPTKTRPSSEALLRRVRRGDAFPRVNTLVDVVNWCSLELQLPYGLYDAAAIDGPAVLRIGREGEAYPGIRKDVVHVAGRLTLADRQGPFGNPTSDSWRTRATTATTRAVVVAFVPAALPADLSAGALALTRARAEQFCR